MSYEELKKKLKEIERQEKLLSQREYRLRETYKRKNAPLKLRMYERITVRLKVTEETRKCLTEKECRMRKWQLGHEYSVTGCFDGWYIHEDGNGEILPILNGGGIYSRFDELLRIERAEQIDGHCSKCRKYKDGYCYLAGGKNLGKSYATHKVGKDDFTCPKYEELTELWRDGKHYPNVTILKHNVPITYRIYSLDWQYYSEWSESIIKCNYQFKKPKQ